MCFLGGRRKPKAMWQQIAFILVLSLVSSVFLNNPQSPHSSWFYHHFQFHRCFWMTLSSILILLSLSFQLSCCITHMIILAPLSPTCLSCKVSKSHVVSIFFSFKGVVKTELTRHKNGSWSAAAANLIYVSLKCGNNHDKSFGDDMCKRRQSCLCKLKSWQSNNHDSHIDDDMCKENNIAHLRQSCRLPWRARRLGHKLQFSVLLINLWTG